MRQHSKVLKLTALSILVVGALGTGSAMAVTTEFTAVINTSEFSIPTPSCALSHDVPGALAAGVGAGTGTTTLFAKNSAKEPATVVLTSFDCVSSPDAFGNVTFGSGKFTLTGPAGEMIFATYKGKLQFRNPNPDPAAPGTVIYDFDPSVTTFTVQGGTGRYLRATGFGTITGTEIVNPANFTSKGVLNAKGQITY